MQAADHIKSMISLIDSVINEFESNVILIKQYEDEHNDLIHEIAHGDKKSASEAYKIYSREREILSERHRLQDENAKAKELYDWCMQNKPLKSTFNKMLSNHSVVAKRIEERAFTPRVRNDLTIKKMNAPRVNKEFEAALEKMDVR